MATHIECVKVRVQHAEFAALANMGETIEGYTPHAARARPGKPGTTTKRLKPKSIFRWI
jgi:hypothetical protein